MSDQATVVMFFVALAIIAAGLTTIGTILLLIYWHLRDKAAEPARKLQASVDDAEDAAIARFRQ